MLDLEGLRAPQRLRAEVRHDLEVLPLGVRKIARFAEDERERADRPAVDEERKRRDGREAACHLQVFELGVPLRELFAASDEDRLSAPHDVATERGVLEGHEGERQVVGVSARARDEHQSFAGRIELGHTARQRVHRRNELRDDDASDVAARRGPGETRADQLETFGPLARLLRLDACRPFTLEERFVVGLRGLSSVDVEGDSRCADNLAVLPEHHLAHALEPVDRPVGPHAAVVEPKRSALLDGLGDLAHDPLAVVGMQPGLPRVEGAGECRAVHAEQLGRVRVPLDLPRTNVPRPAAHARRPHREGEALVEEGFRVFRHGSASFAATHARASQYGPAPPAPAFNTCVSSACRAQPDRVQSIAK